TAIQLGLQAMVGGSSPRHKGDDVAEETAVLGWISSARGIQISRIEKPSRIKLISQVLKVQSPGGTLQRAASRVTGNERGQEVRRLHHRNGVQPVLHVQINSPAADVPDFR